MLNSLLLHSIAKTNASLIEPYYTL